MPDVGKVRSGVSMQPDMEADPQFKALRYSDQQQMRLDKLQTDPAFLALPDADKVQMLQDVLKRPPAFQDSRYVKIAQTVLEKTGGRIGPQGKEITIPEERTTAEVYSVLRGAYSFPLFQLASRAGQSVAEGIFGKERTAPNILSTTDPDAQKLHEYVNQNFSAQLLPEPLRQAAETASQIPVVGTVGGMVFAPLASKNVYETLGGEGAAFAALGPVFRGAGAIQGSLFRDVAVRGLALRGAKLATRMATSGGIGAGVAAADAAMNDQAVTLHALWKGFSDWAAADMVFGLAGEGVSRLARNITGPSQVILAGTATKIWDRIATSEALARVEANRLQPGSIDFDRLPNADQKMIIAKREIDAAVKVDPDILNKDPVLRMQAAALYGPMESGGGGLGISITRNADGTFDATNFQFVDGGSTLLKSASLTEVKNLLSERYEASLSLIQEKLQKANKKVEALGMRQAREEAAGITPSESEYQEALRVQQSYRARLNSLEGIGKDGLAGTFSARSALRAGLQQASQGARDATTRAGMNYSEMEGLGKNLGTVFTEIPLGKKDLKTVVREGRVFQRSDAIPVTSISMSESNAVMTFSKLADEGAYQLALAQADKYRLRSGTSVPREQLAQGYLMDAGYDAVRRADNTYLSLYPNLQIKHLSDYIDPKTGKYRGYPFTPKGGETAEGGDVRAAQGLAGDIRISRTISEVFPDMQQAAVLRPFMAKATFGKINADDMSLLMKTILKQSGLDITEVKVVPLEDVLPVQANLKIEKGTATVFVPKNVPTVFAQEALVKALGSSLTDAMKENAIQEIVSENVGQLMLAKEKRTGKPTTDLEIQQMAGRIRAAMELDPQGRVEIRRRGGRAPWVKGALADNLYRSPVGADPQQTIAWMSYITEKDGVAFQPQENGLFTIRYMDKAPFTGTLEQVVDDYLVSNTAPSALRADLAAKGYDFRQSTRKGETKFWIEDRRGEILGGKKYASIYNLLKETGIRPEKISGRYGPTSVEMQEDGSYRITYGTRSGVYRLQEAIYQLGRYTSDEAAGLSQVIRRTENGTVGRLSTGHYTVDMKQFGIHKEFETAQEAAAYVMGEFQSYRELYARARGQGMTIYPDNGKLIVSGANARYVCEGKEEVLSVLAKLEDPQWAPGNFLTERRTTSELSQGFGATESGAVDLHDSDPALIAAHVGFARGAARALARFFGTRQPVIEAMAKREGNTRVPKALYDTRQATRLYVAQTTDETNAMMRYFQYKNGMQFSTEESIAMGHYLEALDETGKAKVLKSTFSDPSSEKAREFAENGEALREFFGQNPASGKFAQLGMDPNKYVVGWFTRARKYVAENPEEVARLAAMGPKGLNIFLSKIKIPAKDYDFYATHERTVQDLAEVLREPDARVALSRYIAQANYAKYVAPYAKTLWEAANGGAMVSPGLRQHVNNFLTTLRGSTTTDLDAMLRIASQEIGTKLSPTGSSNKLLNYLYNGPSAFIFFGRPMSALRNIADTYINLGAFMESNRLVDRGVDVFLQHPEQSLRELYDQRYVSERAPSVQSLTAGGGKLQQAFNRFVTTAHKGIMNGDLVGRAVTLEAGKLHFDEMMRRYQANPGMNLSDALFLFRLNESAANDIVTRLSAGDLEGARVAYIRDLMDWNNYTFRPEDQNYMRNSGGIPTRLWGQLQSVGFQQNTFIVNIAMKGTAAQRARAMAIYTANALATAKGMRMMGINGATFLPWSNLSLGGGPAWNIVMDTMQASEGDKEAIRRLESDIARRLVPGGELYHRASTALGYLKQMESGDVYAGWLAVLAATGTPIRSDLRRNEALDIPGVAGAAAALKGAARGIGSGVKSSIPKF